tara:strand:- start:4299 stop:6047 length:1749 start_codon:yes stop_codon:yes gene_type:complete
MKLLNLNKKLFFSLIISIFFTPLFSEDSVDIWKKENLDKKSNTSKKKNISLEKTVSKININSQLPKQIEINTESSEINKNLVYGIYEPDENNLTLDMWVNSEGTRIKDTIERVNKIKLSLFAEEIFINTLFTISKLPKQNMTDTEFINYKLDWLIDNNKDKLIASFLNKNKKFPNKKKIIRYLVDSDIAKANLDKACQNITLISNDIKNSYLEQFKIICLIKNNKKNEAQLILDLLREQKLSNKFFDNKINYLLGLNDKIDTKIDDTNLLNFYLSSIAIPDFAYTPSKKTDKKIWQYLTAANLIKISDFENKEQIKELEIAANNNFLSKIYIFEIYKNFKFNINDFLNTDQIYPTIDTTNARALIYQKILLSDNVETKLKYLFLLNNLFKKDNLSNVYKEYLDSELKLLDPTKIPLQYKQLVTENIIYKKKNSLGKIKYNDKNYHTSRIIKFYTEKSTFKKKPEKEFEIIYKKIKRNKKYKTSLKDIILFETLESDGIIIPKELIDQETVKNNLPPPELLNLGRNNETGLLLLRIVELIGEDEILDLDTQTIYFINHLLIKSGIKKFSNKILITVLPERTKI